MIRRPAALVVLLTGLNLLNYLDRLVVSAVLPRIQEDLGLSNFMGGLLATVFLLGYFVTSPVFGALGDRMPRKGLMAFGVAVWSLATVASGFATTAMGLLIARACVGIGEASYATLAPTLIDDVVPKEKKGRALAIFYVATPVGAALGYLVGGFVEQHWGWRSAFFVAGGPGLLLAVLCLLIQEPERKPRTDRPNLRADLASLVRLHSYRIAVLGYAAYTAAVGGFSYWAPKYLYARFGMSLSRANFTFGLITVVAGICGTALGGTWSDRATRGADEATTTRKLLWICAVGSAAGAPLAVLCFLSPTPTLFFVAVFGCELALFLSTSPINNVILRSVPPALRASAMALSIFAIHILGDLWSPPAVGLLADHLPITLAMMLLPAAIFVSALLWWPRRRAATPS